MGGDFSNVGFSQDGFQESFDDFVEGGADEAEELFVNERKPVHCLSTRFGGVNFRVSMFIVAGRRRFRRGTWPYTTPTSTTGSRR